MSKIIPLFILSITTTIFVFLLTGSEYQTQEAEPIGEAPDGTIEIIQSILSKVWNVILFIYNAITFNVPGAPWYVRAVVTTLITAPILWGIALLIRGGGAD